MQVRSIFVSRFFIRCVEVAGAGVVSALCAYFLSQIQLGKPAATSTQVPQVAQVSTVNQLALAAGESVRVVHEAPVPVVETAPTEAQPQKDEPPKKPESTAAAPVAPAAPPAAAAAPAPKPAKPAQTAQPRREAKPRAPEPVQPPVAAAPPVAPPAQSADAAPAANSAEGDRPLFERLKLVPSWFSAKSEKPAADKPAERPAAEVPRPTAEVPRPPMPVGDPLRSAM